MAGLYSRVKSWVTKEILTAADLNAEFDNVINNFIPTQIDDYSASVSEMQTQTDPGSVGSESQPTNLAGEIERLRYAIDGIIGKTYWYDTPAISVEQISSALNVPATKIVSGLSRAGSSQLIALSADGAALTVDLNASGTPFVYDIEGTRYTLSSDISKTLLTAAPSSNNTCLVNDPFAADQEFTKIFGTLNYSSSIPIDTEGSEITSLVGTRVAFKINNGTDDEYFTGVLTSSSITLVERGNYFDSSDAPVPPIVYSDNDVITLLKLTWVFLTSAGTLDVTYNEPKQQAAEPATPALGDYWFDTANAKWKKYDGASYNDATAIAIGTCVQDSSNCIGARTDYIYVAPSRLNTLEIEKGTGTSGYLVETVRKYAECSVFGTLHRFGNQLFQWDVDNDKDTGVSLGGTDSRMFLYIKEDGSPLTSDVRPISVPQLQGLYHPFQTWRAVGRVSLASTYSRQYIDYGENFDFQHRDPSTVLLSKSTIDSSGHIDIGDAAGSSTTNQALTGTAGLVCSDLQLYLTSSTKPYLLTLGPTSQEGQMRVYDATSIPNSTYQPLVTKQTGSTTGMFQVSLVRARATSENYYVDYAQSWIITPELMANYGDVFQVTLYLDNLYSTTTFTVEDIQLRAVLLR